MGGIFFKRKCRGSNFVLQFSNSIAWFCLYKIKKSVVYFYQNLAHSESYNGYNGHSGAFLRRRFLVPPSATSSCMYLLDLDSACVSILMPLMSRHCLTHDFLFLASENQNDEEMQNKIIERDIAREERKMQHNARLESKIWYSKILHPNTHMIIIWSYDYF